MIIFIVLSSAMGLVVMQDLISDENQSSNVDNYTPEVKNIQIKVSDGVGTDSKG